MEVVRFESEEGEETFVLIQGFSTLSILLSLRLLPVQYQSGPSCQTETKRILANQLDLGEALDILSSVLFIPKKKKDEDVKTDLFIFRVPWTVGQNSHYLQRNESIHLF